jgi:hypothetical protein
MSIVAFVLGSQRFEGKNWENVEIDDDLIRYNPFSFSWPVQTNWSKLVAQAVDEAGGKGWVTEFAGSTSGFAEQVSNQVESGSFATEEDEEAALALLEVLEAHPYMTRLYTRVSAEEMTLDPIFGRSSGGDVSRTHQLSATVDGVDVCSADTPDSVDPCEFVTCGAAGICRVAMNGDAGAAGAPAEVAACGCLPGATARTTFAPDGTATVICQDARMSFLNPGDQEAGMPTLPDPCATFDCGSFGHCTPVNMTPTCVCDEGYVAIGSFGDDGRVTTCVEPLDPVPTDFYDNRLPELPSELPGGREVAVPEPASSGSGGSSNSTDSTSSRGASASGASGGGCSIAGERRASGLLALALLGLAGWVRRGRERH